MLSLKEKLAKNYINARGWRTKKKLLLIESDDWGAIRMPSKGTYEKLLKAGIKVDKLHIDKYDSLESAEDLKALFEVLSSYEDQNGNHPVLTAYHVVANPNFEKIEASGRNEYHFETILDTYKRFSHTRQAPQLIKKGFEKGMYIPQSHGREHIHVKRWMEAINSDSEKEQIAFENRAIISSQSSACTNPYPKNYFAGQDYSDEEEWPVLEQTTDEGLRIFKEIFGYKSLSFMAQGSIWGDHLLESLHHQGVKLISGQQTRPLKNANKKYEVINKWWGQKNKLGQLHWRRNCMFEPARNQSFSWVEKCLSEIEIAFRWGKPAVISAHRENFIGSIFPSNRDQSLEKLAELLSAIVKRWPNVEFISTPTLAKYLKSVN